MKKLTPECGYTMPVLSEQEVLTLTGFARKFLDSLDGLEPENPEEYDEDLEEYTKIIFVTALAALTAEPVAMRYRWEPPHMKMPDGGPFTGDWKIVADAAIANPGRDYRREYLFTAPPVPVKQEGEQ